MKKLFKKVFTKETRDNKIVALLLIGVGLMPAVFFGDATILVFTTILAIGLFFAKENHIG